MWLLHTHNKCIDQLVCARQSGARSENDRAYRICKLEHTSYYLYRYFQSGDSRDVKPFYKLDIKNFTLPSYESP